MMVGSRNGAILTQALVMHTNTQDIGYICKYICNLTTPLCKWNICQATLHVLVISLNYLGSYFLNISPHIDKIQHSSTGKIWVNPHLCHEDGGFNKHSAGQPRRICIRRCRRLFSSPRPLGNRSPPLQWQAYVPQYIQLTDKGNGPF